MQKTGKPNIIFLFADQQRFDTVGCYGQPALTGDENFSDRGLADKNSADRPRNVALDSITPNLDAMAAEGVRFEYAFTPQPVCGPARACLQTGKYATEIGCFRNDIALPRGEKTLAHHGAAAGYDLGYVGKWHLASSGLKQNYKTKPVPLEFRGGWNGYWVASDVLEFTSTGYGGHLFNKDMQKVEFSQYRADALTDYGLDYIRNCYGERDDSKPFFLFLSYLEPHHQNTTHQYEGPKGSKERFADFVVPKDLEGTDGDWEKSYPDYLGCCNSLDTNLGRIRAELERLELAENTLIIYTSDHGSHFCTRNGEYKRSCHESSIRVPLVACGPGFRGGKVVDDLVSLLDLPPTLLSAMGAEAPADMRGAPLQVLPAAGLAQGLDNAATRGSTDMSSATATTTDMTAPPAATQPATAGRDEIFIQISESHVGRALRTKKWKYSVRAPGKQGYVHAKSRAYVEDFLYDLESDPYEKHNLVQSPAHAEVRQQLAARLQIRMVEAGEKEPRIYPKSWWGRLRGLV